MISQQGYSPSQGNTRSILVPTPDYRPVDGYCMEAFIASESLADKYHFGCNASALNFTVHPAKYWRLNMMKFMDAAQSGLAALPMIAQAGCKAIKLEMLGHIERDAVESFGYASYLLAVNASNTLTRFGLPAFYQENGRRFAHVHERYSWPIGEPTLTHVPNDIDKYQPSGHLSYVRPFSNGLVVVNPHNTTDHALSLGDTYTNPQTGEKVSSLDVTPQTGFILLKKV